MNIRSIKKDVRGAALIYVIVAATLIILLGAATTVTAYVNLRTTEVQERSDNNFYNADAIMSAVQSGLESDISKAYEVAYTEVIVKYDTYPNFDEAQEAFATIFKNELYKILNDGAESFDFMYSTAHIENYVQSVFKTDVRYTISALNGNNYLDVIDNGIVLRNFHVTYEDDTGYFDEITTDIKINIPEFIGTPPVNIDVFNGFVIDDGLEVDFGKGIEINGDLYVNERESDRSAVLLNDQTSLFIESPTITVLGGLVKTKDDTIFSVVGGDEEVNNEIWTENVDIGRHTTATLDGHSYVLDDFEVNGSYTKVFMRGEYFGYSQSSAEADGSSAININGAHTEMDISELKRLVLGGTSYMSTKEVVSGDPDYVNTTDIQMGESFAVKSNQIAYFVDDSEFEKRTVVEEGQIIIQKDIPGFVSNPMSYEQYEEMIRLNGNKWENVQSKIEKKRLSYGKTYEQFGAKVVRIFSAKDNGTVYLYLNFTDPAKAAQYFTEAFKGNTKLSSDLRNYASQYINSLKLDSTTKLSVSQNYIDSAITLYTADSLTDYDPDRPDGLGYHKEVINARDFSDLLTSCNARYLGDGTVNGDGVKYSVMYEKLINEEALESFIANATGSNTYSDANTDNHVEVIPGVSGVILNGTSGAQAIVVNNKNGEAYELGEGRGVVVVSGDLKITGNWLGTIIVGGRAYVTEGTKITPLNITADTSIVSSVLPLYFTMKNGDVETYTSFFQIFRGYENLKTNESTDDHGIDADLLSNCLTFTNWNKQ